MLSFSVRESVEVFHLVFLRVLVAKGEDKTLFALKGGCNLRFFFGSMRYSEDIDLDVTVVAKDTLKKKVDRVLRSPALASLLMSHGLEIEDTSAPKQTETTQRWKIGLRGAALSIPVRTKIEFSRRDSIAGAAFEAIDPEILRHYGMTPFLATHYVAASAVVQKIRALADRSEPQPRDVLDLNHLFARSDVHELKLSERERAWLPKAIEHAIGISFDEYAAKVVAYLAPAQRELFEERDAWNTMQAAVVERLESLR
jgi:predicted nucleotidyltransferase component of viral defense system